MTAEFPPTGGDAILGSFSVSNEPEQTRRRIGYCPQFDAHFMNMTGREHVELYAAIKGVDQKVVKEAAEAKLAEVGLSVFDSNRLSAGYSGGMKVGTHTPYYSFVRAALYLALIHIPRCNIFDHGCTTTA